MIENGQITKLVNAVDGDGHWRLAFEMHTARGPVLGTLHGPANGVEGRLVFVPDSDLTAAALAQDEAGGDAPAEGAGTLTTETVPGAGGVTPADGEAATRGVSQDDPRGIRGGKPRGT